MKKINLFCIPYAGGTATIYKKLFDFPNKEFEVKFLELPGRGIRFIEPLLDNMSEVVNDLFELNREEFEHEPYCLFGYSMGSWIAYELMQKIREEKCREPLHIFLGAQESPWAELRENYHMLPKEEFVSEVAKLNGIAQEVLENQELLDIYLPILYADYKLTEEYVCNKNRKKLNISLTILQGTDDFFEKENIELWSQVTDGACEYHYFQGGHFFIFDYAQDIVDIINKVMQQGT